MGLLTNNQNIKPQRVKQLQIKKKNTGINPFDFFDPRLNDGEIDVILKAIKFRVPDPLRLLTRRVNFMEEVLRLNKFDELIAQPDLNTSRMNRLIEHYVREYSFELDHTMSYRLWTRCVLNEQRQRYEEIPFNYRMMFKYEQHHGVKLYANQMSYNHLTTSMRHIFATNVKRPRLLKKLRFRECAHLMNEKTCKYMQLMRDYDDETIMQYIDIHPQIAVEIATYMNYGLDIAELLTLADKYEFKLRRDAKNEVKSKLNDMWNSHMETSYPLKEYLVVVRQAIDTYLEQKSVRKR